MSRPNERLSSGAFVVTVVGAPLVVVIAGLALVARRIAEEPDAAVAGRLVVGFGVAAGAVAVLLLVVRVVDRRRRRRRTHEYDDLTGLPAGSELRGWTGAMLASTDHSHHLVAVVRIAELDLVEAIYGDALRDRVVIDVANRLRAGVAWLTGARSDATATLLATGRAEFVVSLHACTEIDVELDRRVFTLRSGRVLLFDGERVPVSWTVGFGRVRPGADVDAIVAEARADSYGGTLAARSPASITSRSVRRGWGQVVAVVRARLVRVRARWLR